MRRQPDFPKGKTERKNNLHGVGRMLRIVLGISNGVYAASRISRRERRWKTKTEAGEKLAFHPAPVLFSVTDTA